MDYVYFVYGLAFVLLAAICATIRHDEPGSLPWSWLGLFGLCHGTHEWFVMLVLPLGDSAGFYFLRLGMLTLSFAVLLEFGRKAWIQVHGRGPGRWIHVPLLVGALAGGWAGLDVINVTVRYMLGLPAAAWGAITLLRAAPGKGKAAIGLILGGVSLACYALATGVVVPAASFPPASLLNDTTFFAHTGIPVQIVRAVLAIMISASLWTYHLQRRRDTLGTDDGSAALRGFWAALALALVLGTGWGFTHMIGGHADNDIRESILSYTRVAASLLNPDMAKPRLHGTGEGVMPGPPMLERELAGILAASPQFRWAHLLALDEPSRRVSVVASFPAYQGGPGDQCESIFRQPSEGIFDAFAGHARLVGPYSDETGAYISGFAPVRDRATGKVTAVLALDLDAAQWRKDVAEFRLAVIAVTFMISLLLMVFFVVRQRTWEATEEIKRLNTALEARVQTRTAELSFANEELESFAYSVSHDLRAPLRHVTGFINLLKQSARGRLDPQSDGYLEDSAREAARMAALIDDLLAFSRNARVGMHKARFELAQLLKSVVAQFEPETKGRRIVWHIGALPEVVGDADMLRQVLSNLVDNALKFTRPREQAEIEVGSRREHDEWVVFVRDNGVGFNPAYADKLFGVFQRLHTQAQFEGTGVGLANVRRIIKRHGGRTWAESRAERGATFYFSMPVVSDGTTPTCPGRIEK